ncbi:unannotated protein [freshwater metagenome]|uniref:Unannotated protein n=1 Tax=freshwater metagenome TaxID=449393 RepID=A0A6J6HH85_9ZZZZ
MRGIGVAVITKTSGVVVVFLLTDVSEFSPLPRSAARCSTPKRCCSSITATPSDANSTPSCINACVPIKISTPPLAKSRSNSRRRSLVTRLVNNSTRNCRSPNKLLASGTSNPSRSFFTPLKCCSAKTSVGAISAPWCPP